MRRREPAAVDNMVHRADIEIEFDRNLGLGPSQDPPRPEDVTGLFEGAWMEVAGAHGKSPLFARCKGLPAIEIRSQKCDSSGVTTRQYR